MSSDWLSDLSVSSDEGLRVLPQIGLHCLQVTDERLTLPVGRAPAEHPLPCLWRTRTCPPPSISLLRAHGWGECLDIEHSSSFIITTTDEMGVITAFLLLPYFWLRWVFRCCAQAF